MIRRICSGCGDEYLDSRMSEFCVECAVVRIPSVKQTVKKQPNERNLESKRRDRSKRRKKSSDKYAIKD